MSIAAAAPLTLKQRLLLAWRARFAFWVERRIPPSRSIVLSHRNIFIIPNFQGLGFLLVLGLMFIGAINYEMSLAFALVFLLLGVFVLTIFYTFRNMAGLQLAAVPGSPVFAGEKAELIVIVSRNGERTYESIQASFPGTRKLSCDLLESHEERLGLFVPTHKRGWQSPGRLVVETIFPFGICRAWSLLDLDCRTLVYPRPVACDLDWLLSNQPHTGNTTVVRGSDDFHGLRDYREGDSLKHVAWKILARGRGMYTKEYASTMDEKIWLTWDMFGDMGSEEKLSRLCWCVIQLDAAGVDYGLNIPGTRLVPAKGQVHYATALRALALYGLAGATP
ncbi:MAG TPA: DUF58 domain-containing protein [Candidatus Acidoferrum sp.]|nr:DUF58 domain-containing protein [Candidatus Acidoferrum sp.]